MIEICEFHPEEIDEVIESLNELQHLIVPLLREKSSEGQGEEDARQFQRHIMLAKHAVVMMGDFLASQMEGGHEES